MNAVELAGIRKRYGGRTVLDLPELTLPEGEFFVLVGPSGSGKTTLLRILAGFVVPDEGSVRLHGQDAAGLPPHERRLGLVFQGLALWPHLSVRGNLALGLERVVPDRAERAERIRSTAAELGIEAFLAARPGSLSGGEQQRVALARALVRQPRLLLLDEPFSDLDTRLRRRIARLVRTLHDRHGTTTMLITHDRTDAHLLADRIGVLREGRLAALGPADRLHEAPPSRFAAEFLTDAAVLEGAARADGTVESSLGSLPLANGVAEGQVLFAVRPDELRVDAAGPIVGRVQACEFAGGPWRCRVALGGGEEVAVLNDRPLEAGAEVRLTPPAQPRHVLREDA